jgi:hypothetical protein
MDPITHRNLIDLDADYKYQQWKDEQVRILVDRLNQLDYTIQELSDILPPDAVLNMITPLDEIKLQLEHLL